MKAQTVEQYYILKWIEQNFYIDALKVALIARQQSELRTGMKTLKITLYWNRRCYFEK